MLKTNLKQLETFVTVADCRSFTKASELLYISQSTVSAHIATLEEILNVTLLLRGARQNISLTNIGEQVYIRAKEIVSSVAEVENFYKKLNGDNIAIGASTIPSQYILPALLAKFSEMYPTTKYSLTQNNSSEVHNLLLNKQIRIGFVGDIIDKKKFNYVKISEDELVLIAPNIPEFKVSKKQDVDIADFINKPLLLREKKSGTRRTVDQFLKQNGIDESKLNIIAEMENTESIKKSVIQGLGISFISKLAIKTESEENKIIVFSFSKNIITRNIYLCYKKDVLLNNTEQTFINFIKKAICLNG